MRPVDLLPARHRPAQATGGARGSAYAVVGALAVLLACVAALSVSLERIASGRAEIAELKAETSAAQARAAALGDFGAFAEAKQARLASVRQVAGARVDWERLVRELAHVLPHGVWLRSAEAASAGPSSPAAAPASAAASAAGAGGPTLALTGCAPDHRAVAATLVRLRRLHRAEEVRLGESGSLDAGAAPAGVGGASDSGGCGRGNEWSATVELAPEPASPDGEDGVPSSLGGGS